ncbi:MAG: SOS response-associated peptidase [Anaerolineales bacterium]|nr:SOS response-associated peptidase [Anaerolineales bacterium]
MCGRFTLTVDAADLQQAFSDFSFPAVYTARYNIAPTQPVLAIANDNRNTADFFLWGLIPSWSRDPSIGSRLINARAETLGEKPAFRGSYKYHRCLIPADGFYEWKQQPGAANKIPYFIHMNDHRPFALAGLWDEWQSPDGSHLKSCTIITTQPNQLLASIHNRMPVILPAEAYPRWLAPQAHTPDELNALLTPYPADRMAAYPVSTLVNKPANDLPELIQPAE